MVIIERVEEIPVALRTGDITEETAKASFYIWRFSENNAVLCYVGLIPHSLISTPIHLIWFHLAAESVRLRPSHIKAGRKFMRELCAYTKLIAIVENEDAYAWAKALGMQPTDKGNILWLK